MPGAGFFEPSPEEMRTDMALACKAARSAASYVTSNGAGVHLVYSTTSSWPYPSSDSLSTSNSKHSNSSGSDRNSQSSRTIDIAVLDSSFNPPSLAHLALLMSRPILAQQQKQFYDGHLLLFSTQNADKGAGKPGDASLEQRVKMMTLMAKDVERIHGCCQPANVAVGLVDKPLIFAKSTLTWDLLKQKQQQHLEEEAKVRLHWVVGFDTLYRVFQLKYYPSLEEFRQQCSQFFEREGTTFVCARRDPSSYPQLSGSQSEGGNAEEQAKQEEDRLLASDNVAPWVQAGSVGMLDLSPSKAKISSTEIRSLLRDSGVDAEGKRELLKEWVPPALVEYLVDSGIYRGDA